MPEPLPRILIVDDDADNLANLSDILADLGYRTETADNGRTAIEMAGKPPNGDGCRFDLCLLDFEMPEMNGADLLAALRSRHPNLLAIMITAHAGEDGVRRALEAGIWKVLRKPVNIGLLLEMIGEAVA